MELLMQMQREADKAAANPARNDSPMGFNEMRELAELARKLAYENFLLNIQAVLNADQTVAGQREERVKALQASKSGYDFASKAVGLIENAHAAFLGATAEMLEENVPKANEFARLSSAMMGAASKELARLADAMKDSPLFANAVAAVRKVDKAFDAGMRKIEVHLATKSAELHANPLFRTIVADAHSVDTWAVHLVTNGIRAASRVAADIAARVLAMPDRIVEAAKAASETIVGTTMRFAAGLLSKSYRAGQLVEKASDVMFDMIDKTTDEIVRNVKAEAAGVAAKALGVVGTVVGAAVAKLDQLDSSIDIAGARLAPLVGAALPTNLKDRIEARLGSVPTSAAPLTDLAVSVVSWQGQAWAQEASKVGVTDASDFSKFTDLAVDLLPPVAISVEASLQALDASGKEIADAALSPVIRVALAEKTHHVDIPVAPAPVAPVITHGSSIDDEEEATPVRERMST